MEVQRSLTRYRSKSKSNGSRSNGCLGNTSNLSQSSLGSPTIPEFEWAQPNNGYGGSYSSTPAMSGIQSLGSGGLNSPYNKSPFTSPQVMSNNPFLSGESSPNVDLGRTRSRYRKVGSPSTGSGGTASPRSPFNSTINPSVPPVPPVPELHKKSSHSRLRINTNWSDSDSEGPKSAGSTARSVRSGTKVIPPSATAVADISFRVQVHYMSEEPSMITIKKSASVDYLLQLCQVKWGSTGVVFLVYEVWNDGMLREMNLEEEVKKTVDSWPKTARNYIRITDRTMTPRLPVSRGPIETEILTKVQYYRDLSSWKSIYLYMSPELGLILSKKESDAKMGYSESLKSTGASLSHLKFKHKDARAVSLSNFKIYYHLDEKRKAIKPPKQFTVVVKSLQNMDFFENKSDSIFVFSTDDVSLIHSIIRIVDIASRKKPEDPPFQENEPLSLVQNRLASGSPFNKNSLLDRQSLEKSISPSSDERIFNSGGLLSDNRFPKDKIYKQNGHVNPLAKDKDIIKQDSLLGRAITMKRV